MTQPLPQTSKPSSDDPYAKCLAWFGFGVLLTALLVVIANYLFNRYWLGDYETLFDDLTFIVPFLTVPLLAIVSQVRRRRWLYLFAAFGGDGLVFVVTLIILGSNPIPGGDTPIFHGPRDADWSLEYSLPPVFGDQREFVSLDQFTSDELNRLQPAKDIRKISYVPANVASTGPDVVSVNPIDSRTWGAAAYSVQAKRCYVVLYREVKQLDQFTGQPYWIFQDTWTELPAGDDCVGRAAVQH